MTNKKNQHKIPKTYLKAWSKNNKTVKSYLKIYEKTIITDPISTLFSENYKYSYSVGSLWKLHEAENEIFSCLQNFRVIYKGEQLSDFSEMHRLWNDFSNWDIYDCKDEKVKNSEIRHFIENKKSQYIEDKWNSIYEKDWKQKRNEFIISVENHLNCWYQVKNWNWRSFLF